MTADLHRSGDPRADRRADYAESCARAGELGAAVDLMRQALGFAPGWLLGRVRLAELQAESGAADAAAETLEDVLTADTADPYGVRLKLAALGLAPPPPAAPPAYVETLFDDYADRFERSLVDKLGYKMPSILMEELAACRSPLFFEAALDLGCGTGLMGEALRPFVRRLDGIDLSRAMLRKARAKAVYDTLVAGDLLSALQSHGGHDLVAAADVLIYFGDLAPVFRSVAQHLPPGGLFAFSVEASAREKAFTVGPSLRYAHAEEPLRGNLKAAGFSVLRCRHGVMRQDRGADVQGIAVVAERD